MSKKFIIVLFVLLFSCSFANQPFEHDLHLLHIPGASSKVMIAAHGMGGNYTIVHSVKADRTLISFNFPDHDCHKRGLKAEKTAFGTIDELLPLLYVIKNCVVTDGHQEIDLYGFSAGGGAIINTLGVLNTTRHDEILNKIGIGQKEKAKMVQAIQKGVILLDAPLKSIREIIALKGASKDLEIVAKRYQANDMEPIDALKYLKGLSLHVILYFHNPDETLSNRDDALFYDRLKTYNGAGTTHLIIGTGGGHNTSHTPLWEFYSKKSNIVDQK